MGCPLKAVLNEVTKRELRAIADEAEAERLRLDWPYLLRVSHHPGLDRAVVTVTADGQRPSAAVLPLDEAVLLRKALDSVIGSMRARRDGAAK
jgi:hypothetical protein